MKKIKILHISPDGVLFGTERHILSIVKNSNRNEFVHTVSVPREGSFTDELKLIGVQYHVGSRMPSKTNVLKGLFENKGVLKLLKLLKNGEFDIIHTHLNSYGGFLAKFSGKKNIVHTRHGIFWTEDELNNISKFKKRIQNLKSDYFTKTIALSEIEKKIMVDNFEYDPNKIEIIYNGVDIQEISSKLDPLKTKLELFNSNDFIVGSIGRFERQKGYHLFIEAAEEVVKSNNNLKFVLIGRGSLKHKLIEQLNEAKLENNFIILDYQKNIFDYLDKFDIMVSSSLWEGVPYAILEALALGKPTIAFTSNLSGVNEIFDTGKDGFLITKNFVSELTSLILKLYSDKKLYQEISKNSIEKIKSKFSESYMIEQTESLYRSILLNSNRN